VPASTGKGSDGEPLHMRADVVPFAPSHLAEAAGLLAARHRAVRAQIPVLPAAYEEPAAARLAIERLLQDRECAGFVAVDRGKVVGYLIGRRQLSPETTIMAIKFDQRATVVPFAGFAATAGSETTVLRALYADAAAAWVDEGFFAHYVTTSLLPATVEPWFSLGFGQRVLHGIRPIGDPDGGDAGKARAGITARRAGPDDCEAVHALIGDLMRHHAPSPIFMPFLPEAVNAERHEIRAWLSDPAVAYFLAEVDGEPVGVTGMHAAEGFVDELRRPDQSAYLYIGHVRSGVRNQGLGTGLVELGLAWARESGYRACVVGWYTAGELASEFWPKRGFAPVTTRLERRVDERVAWAKVRG
jgi:GNAT superfamily N-acetyltransferase